MIGLESALKILDSLGGVIKWVWDKVSSRQKAGSNQISIPKKTLIVLPSTNKNSLWWHMGAILNGPAMQIAGQVRVTNTTTYKIFPTLRLREPTKMDMLTIMSPNKMAHPNPRLDFIPPTSTVDLDFHCFIQPPVRKIGECFVTDVTVTDQFGNEHRISRIEFPSLVSTPNE